ncbi:Uncharacterised protein [Mycobacteroides abscessus subsp. abscessus]|nr:Uncharacterised protein [Mycobacteroides abscessus subsp. abscessus]
MLQQLVGNDIISLGIKPGIQLGDLICQFLYLNRVILILLLHFRCFLDRELYFMDKGTVLDLGLYIFQDF